MTWLANKQRNTKKKGGLLASWNPDDKAAGVVLTNDNYTMNGAFVGVRAFDGRSSGDNYYEGTFDNPTFQFEEKLGMYLSTQALGECGVGDSIGVLNTSGVASSGLLYNGAFVGGTYAGFAAGDIIMFRWKQSTGDIWVGKNGVWFNSGSPVYTNTAFTTGIWHKGASARNLATEPVTLAQSLTYSPPSGSSPW